MGAVIGQYDNIISFYNSKLIGTQMRYTVTEKHLLSIVKTLKEFRTILLGQKLNIYTNHKI